MTVLRNRSLRSLRSLPRQRGSTLTGIIIGLVIGLGIAVAVALTVTKGASPFTDKVAKTGRPADPPAGQAQDPNKPMYGSRTAAREANKEVTEKAAARSEAASNPPPAPAPASAPVPRPAPAAQPGGDDPLGQAIANLKEPATTRPAAHGADTHLADARPAAAHTADTRGADAHAADAHAADIHAATRTPASPTAPAAAATGDYVYFLQAGAFRDLSDAESTRAKLALLGFEAAISDRSSDSGVLHRVRVGPYNGVEPMNKARAKLLDSGVDVAIVRNQR